MKNRSLQRIVFSVCQKWHLVNSLLSQRGQQQPMETKPPGTGYMREFIRILLCEPQDKPLVGSILRHINFNELMSWW